MDQASEEQQATNDNTFQEQLQQGVSAVKNFVKEKVQNVLEVGSDEPPIDIKVVDPMIKDAGLSKHTIYNVKGIDRIGQFDTYRRYNDFLALREYLVNKWPGCYIPPIPSKEFASGNDDQVVQERKRQLDYFCQIMARIPYLYYSEEFSQIFLRSTQEFAKVITNMPKVNTSEILERYQINFSDLDLKEDNNGEYVVGITASQALMKKNVSFCKSYIEQAVILSQARKFLNDNKVQLLTQILPQYENSSQVEYAGGKENLLVFANPVNIALNDQISQIKDNSKINSMDIMADLMKIEQKDCEAMLQALNQRQASIEKKVKLEAQLRDEQSDLSKVMQGKQTLSTITTSVFSKNKDEAQLKIENKIQETQKEIADLGKLIIYMTAILGHEIPKFNKLRGECFKMKMNQLYETESGQAEVERAMWSNVNELAITNMKLIEQ